MKIMISGGGTGGHIYPAIAIARKIKDFKKDSKIIWIGTSRKLEKELISKTDFDYETIKSRGFSSNSILDNFYSLILLSIGFFQSIFLILKYKPDIILGMGGYACAPTVIAGFILSKKTAIFEPNVILGRANRFLKKWVDLVFVSHKQTLKEIPDNKSNYIGNIVREELKNTPSKKWARQYLKWRRKQF
jgi:UDP-N-acetylglucosamine--N-acetylmuramyl-(pentapeptide) pyrophosphoryl-undecaprenol N-acetylglucosamine transferase